MDAFLIVVSIITCLLFLLIDIYVMAIYSHSDQKNTSIINLVCKFLIMLTLFQIQLQPLFLIVDVVNSRSSPTDLSIFWSVLYFSILANIAVIKPLATSLYERDHDEACWKSTLWVIVELFISVAVFGLFVGLGWMFWGSSSLPITQITLPESAYGMSYANAYVATNVEIKMQVSIPTFLIAFFCVLGLPVLSCCGACGLTVLPVQFILDFVNRPKFRRTADAKKVADFLKLETVRLIKESQRLKRAIPRLNDVDGFFAKRTHHKQFDKDFQDVSNELLLHRQYFELFEMELKMETISPLVFVGKLILGIICAFFSILIWIQILLGQLIFPASTGKGSIFLDRMLGFLENQNANFVSIAFLMLVALFMTCCIIKGAVFFSNSLPFITIHPIIERKTWLNSFLFHLVLCCLSACSLVYFLINTFPYYLRGGEISLILDEILEGMSVLGVIVTKKAFTYIFLGIGFLGVFYVLYKMVFTSQSKGELLKRIEAKRLKLFGKDNQNQSLKFIEMTEMNLNDQPQQKTQKPVEKKKEKRRKVTMTAL